jgi:hypothetical protein
MAWHWHLHWLMDLLRGIVCSNAVSRMGRGRGHVLDMYVRVIQRRPTRAAWFERGWTFLSPPFLSALERRAASYTFLAGGTGTCPSLPSRPPYPHSNPSSPTRPHTHTPQAHTRSPPAHSQQATHTHSHPHRQHQTGSGPPPPSYPSHTASNAAAARRP